MIVNEISLVIQKIFSVKQPKDQRFNHQAAVKELISSSLISLSCGSILDVRNNILKAKEFYS